MSDCERCRNYDTCEMENKGNIDRCFFVYLRENEMAKDTKEYEIGYKQGISDERKRIIDELEEKLNEKQYQHEGEDYYVGISEAIEIVNWRMNNG